MHTHKNHLCPDCLGIVLMSKIKLDKNGIIVPDEEGTCLSCKKEHSLDDCVIEVSLAGRRIRLKAPVNSM